MLLLVSVLIMLVLVILMGLMCGEMTIMIYMVASANSYAVVLVDMVEMEMVTNKGRENTDRF